MLGEARGTSSSSTSSSVSIQNSLQLKPMDAGERAGFHALSKFYRLNTFEYDHDPNRYVSLVRRVDSCLPSVLLSAACRMAHPRPPVNSAALQIPVLILSASRIPLLHLSVPTTSSSTLLASGKKSAVVGGGGGEEKVIRSVWDIMREIAIALKEEGLFPSHPPSTSHPSFSPLPPLVFSSLVSHDSRTGPSSLALFLPSLSSAQLLLRVLRKRALSRPPPASVVPSNFYELIELLPLFQEDIEGEEEGEGKGDGNVEKVIRMNVHQENEENGENDIITRDKEPEDIDVDIKLIEGMKLEARKAEIGVQEGQRENEQKEGNDSWYGQESQEGKEVVRREEDMELSLKDDDGISATLCFSARTLPEDWEEVNWVQEGVEVEVEVEGDRKIPEIGPGMDMGREREKGWITINKTNSGWMGELEAVKEGDSDEILAFPSELQILRDQEEDREKEAWGGGASKDSEPSTPGEGAVYKKLTILPRTLPLPLSPVPVSTPSTTLVTTTNKQDKRKEGNERKEEGANLISVKGGSFAALIDSDDEEKEKKKKKKKNKKSTSPIPTSTSTTTTNSLAFFEVSCPSCTLFNTLPVQGGEGYCCEACGTPL